MTDHDNTSCAESDASTLDSEALDWFVRRMGSDDEHVEHALRAWLAASPDHRAAYARWEEDWLAFDAIKAAAIQPPPPPAPAPPPRRVPAWPRAALASCALAAIVGLGLSRMPESPQYNHHYATQTGELTEVVLPDGSDVTLDAHTSLDVSLFAGRRQVSLPEGQAMFHVRADAGRPFEVIAGPARITVLGTRFAVRHTPGSAAYPGVHIAVASGHVRVTTTTRSWRTLWREAPGQEVELLRGQQLTLAANGSAGAVMSVGADGIAPWRARQLSFEDITLREALAELARYSAVDAIIRDERIASLRVTGTFDADNPETFYRLIASVLPVRLRRTPEGTLIEAPS